MIQVLHSRTLIVDYRPILSFIKAVRLSLNASSLNTEAKLIIQGCRQRQARLGLEPVTSCSSGNVLSIRLSNRDSRLQAAVYFIFAFLCANLF